MDGAKLKAMLEDLILRNEKYIKCKQDYHAGNGNSAWTPREDAENALARKIIAEFIDK